MDFIDDFIQEYKNNPCLWKADSANYKNRTKRQEAYMKLIDVAAKHGEHYNVERTKQKINNLRCAFRHQLKKYNELKTKGEKEEPYCPKRKYFESLMFLKDEETRDKRILNNSNKVDNTGHEVSITSVTRSGIVKNQRRLLSTEAECTTLEVVDGDKQATINGVEDALQVPNNLFSDICKEIHKENGTEGDDDMTSEETTTVNISVISDKGIPLSQDIEEIAITPIRKDQVYIVDTSAANNNNSNNNCATISTTTAATINSNTMPHIKQPATNSKSRKRSSSFSSQHSNETDTTTPIKTMKSDVTLDIENLLSLACKNFQKNASDHYTNFGEIVAHKLRTMDAKQAIYAEKIISDILYQGQMRYLSTATIERCSQIDRAQQDLK